jgi:hypothetical protein
VFDRTVHLGSTVGLPLNVYQKVRIVGQKYLDLNALDYNGIKEVELLSSVFPNFDFLKKWNPPGVKLANIDFKNFSIFGDGLTHLELSNDGAEIDFSEITDLKNLQHLNIRSNEGLVDYNPCFHKERYVNVINMFNISLNIRVCINTNLSSNNVFHIMKKYFAEYDKSEYIMDCLLELLEAGYMYAGGK